MTSNFSFSSLLVEKLAILVQANPVLYNTLDANYKNISLRNSIWKDIAHETEKSVDDIKQIWENIRNSYSRIITRKSETESAFNIKKNWILVHRLKFLEQHVWDQYSTSNTSITETHDAYTLHKEKGLNDMANKTETENATLETNIKNRSIFKFNQIENNLPVISNEPNKKIQADNGQFSTGEEDDQLDDMDMFFQCLTLKVKKFPITGRNEVKMKICTLINELQEKYLVNESPIKPSRMMQPIYLFTEKKYDIPSEQNNFSSSSSIQSCASTIPSLHSDSEFSNSETSYE